MRVKKALEKYLGSIYPAAEVEIFDFCFCGRANIAVRVNFDTEIRTLLKTWNLRAKLLTEIRFWVNRSAIFQSTDRQMPSANHPSRITSNDPRHKRPLTFNAECNVRHDGNICPPAKAEIKDFYFRGRIYRSKIFFQRFFYAHVFIINQIISFS